MKFAGTYGLVSLAAATVIYFAVAMFQPHSSYVPLGAAAGTNALALIVLSFLALRRATCIEINAGALFFGDLWLRFQNRAYAAIYLGLKPLPEPKPGMQAPRSAVKPPSGCGNNAHQRYGV